MKNYKQLWIAVPFLMIIFGIGILNMLAKDKSESLTENRTLQQKPGLQNIISKDYPRVYETYYTDQFIKRDALLKLYTKFEILSKKSTVKDYYIIDNKWILHKNVEKQSEEEIKNLSNKLNKFVQEIKKDGRKVFYVSTPPKSESLKHLYPIYADKGFTDKNINEFEKNLNKKNMTFINLDRYFNYAFDSKEKEKMYFKTDHHWNAYGAFEAFKFIVRNMNVLDKNQQNLLSNSNYYTYELTDRDFIGSYNRNLFYLFSKDENIPFVKSKQNHSYKFFNYNGKEYVPTYENLLISPEINSKEITYAGAYTYDNPLYKILNENAPIAKKLLIVRDSFQAPTSLMFADLFKEVEVLDQRNDIEATVSKAIQKSNPDIVMFMFNSSSYGNMISLIK